MGFGKIFKSVKKIAGPAISFGLGGIGGLDLYSNYSKDRSRGKYADELERQADASYADQKARYEYDTGYNQEMAKWQFENANARAAAAAATERNRQAAARKSQRIMDKAYADQRQNYQPWADTGTRLLPKAEETYGNSLNSMNLLNAYLFRPENMARLNAPQSAFNVDIPLNNFFAGGRKS